MFSYADGEKPAQNKEEKEYYLHIKREFDKLAPFYDVITAPFSRLRETVVSFANARKGSKILDIATGTGKQAFAFARNSYDVIGIDLSEAMLKVARQKNKYANARFETADAASLPFMANGFDVACVSFALHEMPLNIRKKVLGEMVRVTKPDGTIVIVDYALPKNKIGRFLIYHFIKLYEGEYYSQFIKSDLKALLAETGIRIKDELPVLLGIGKILKGIKL